MYQLTFKNICEVRMGSPYNIADIDLRGDFVPDLKGHSFQDKNLISPDGDTVFLVQWDIKSNLPGFKVWKISAKKKEVTKSDIYSGCCEKLCFLPDGSLEIEVLENLKVKKLNLNALSFSSYGTRLRGASSILSVMDLFYNQDYLVLSVRL